MLGGQRLTRYDSRDLIGSESLHSVISYIQKQYKIPIDRKRVKRYDSTGVLKSVNLYWVNPEYIKERGSENKVIPEQA